jgi:hypothetical protein
MILYNITYNIEKDIEADWIDWMKVVYIPKIMNTGYFSSVRFFRLLKIEDEGSTYSVQLMTHTIELIQEFLDKSAHTLAEDHNLRYKNKHVAFQTVLQELDL